MFIPCNSEKQRAVVPRQHRHVLKEKPARAIISASLPTLRDTVTVTRPFYLFSASRTTYLGSERALDEVSEGHRSDERAQSRALSSLLAGLDSKPGSKCVSAYVHSEEEETASGLTSSANTFMLSGVGKRKGKG